MHYCACYVLIVLIVLFCDIVLSCAYALNVFLFVWRYTLLFLSAFKESTIHVIVFAINVLLIKRYISNGVIVIWVHHSLPRSEERFARKFTAQERHRQRFLSLEDQKSWPV